MGQIHLAEPRNRSHQLYDSRRSAAISLVRQPTTLKNFSLNGPTSGKRAMEPIRSSSGEMECTKFEQWAEFRAWIDKDRQILSVYWRGQRDPSWPLASSFERKILNMFGARIQGASRIYPYDGRHERGGKRIWKDGFYQTTRPKFGGVQGRCGRSPRTQSRTS